MAPTEKYRELVSKKDEIETTIKELMDVLDSHGVGMTGALVDAEGYPRADICVYSCRHARHQISCLQNDHVALMKDIEEELNSIHAKARDEKLTTQQIQLTEDMDTEAPAPGIPAFALIDRVDPGSPAGQGGLEAGDRLLEFGSVTADNFVNLKTVGAVLQHSVGKPVRVLVLRNGRELSLTVIPASWSGQGLLGCNIKPIK